MVVAMKKLSNVERVALGSIREELQPSRLDQGAQGRGRGWGGGGGGGGVTQRIIIIIIIFI